MKKFTDVHDIGDLRGAVAEALAVKADRFAFNNLGLSKSRYVPFPLIL